MYVMTRQSVQSCTEKVDTYLLVSKVELTFKVFD